MFAIIFQLQKAYLKSYTITITTTWHAGTECHIKHSKHLGYLYMRYLFFGFFLIQKQSFDLHLTKNNST